MSEDSPLFPLQSQELISETKSLFKSGFPISLTLLADLIAGLISFHFAGKYGKNVQQEIFSQYEMVYGFFILLFVSSNNQGFAILASRLFGAKKYKELGVLYQRNLFTVANLLIVAIVLISLFIVISPGDRKVFLISMIPSVIGVCLFSSTKYFLISQNINNAPAIIVFALIPAHVLLCYIFVDILGMGVSAIGFAKSVTDVTAVILLFSYLRFTGVCRNTLIPWTRECLKSWNEDVQKKHTQQTSQLGVTNSLEIWAYQASSLWLVLMNDVSSEVHSVALCLVYALFCIPLGMSLSMQAKIGHVISEGNQEKVRKTMAGGIALNALFSLVTVTFTIGLRKQTASFFFSDAYSIESLESVLLIFAVAFVFDSYANIIGGALKVIGKEKEVNRAYSVCLLGTVGQWFFCLHYEYISIWLCLAATAFLKFALIIYQACVLNLKEQVEAMKTAIDEEGSVETQGLIEFTEMA